MSFADESVRKFASEPLLAKNSLIHLPRSLGKVELCCYWGGRVITSRTTCLR